MRLECFNCGIIGGCRETDLEKVKASYRCERWKPVMEIGEYQARIDAYARFGDAAILALIEDREE